MAGAYLRAARLAGAEFTGADLRGTDLTDATLRRATLTDAYLVGADLFRVDLWRAVLSDADLRDADLDATFLYALKSDTTITHADFIQSLVEQNVKGWQRIDSLYHFEKSVGWKKVNDESYDTTWYFSLNSRDLEP